MFLKQMNILKKLHPPFFLEVEDFGVDTDNHPYVLLAYEAEQLSTLSERLQHGPLPEDHAEKILGEVSTALVLAHQHDLVYGLLSPENILLTPAGETRLLPFCSSALNTNTARAALPPAYRFPESEASRLSDQYVLAGLVQQLLLEQGSLPEDAPMLQQAISRAQSKELHRRFETLREFLGEVGIPLHLAENEKEFDVLSRSEQRTIGTTGTQPSARFSRRSGKTTPQRFSIPFWLAILFILILISGSVWLVIAHENKLATQAVQSTHTAMSLTSTAFAGTATAEALAAARVQATAQAQATATTSALASLNPDPSFKTLAYHDPMTADSGNWDVGPSGINGVAISGGGDCSFQTDGFHISVPPTKPDSENLVYLPKCQLHNETFSDFSFVTHMKISSGSCGVLIFEDYSSSNFLNYEVDVCQGGNYSIVGDPGNTVGDISKAIKQGPNQINTVAIVIHGSTFTLFINNQRIVSVPVENLQSSFHSIKASFSHCQIALSTTGGSVSSKIIYSDISIWTP
jgi:serine/threonine protein kinase